MNCFSYLFSNIWRAITPSHSIYNRIMLNYKRLAQTKLKSKINTRENWQGMNIRL